MVFNGHMHGYERGQLNGIHYVTSGGGGGNLDSSKPNNWAHITVQNFIHHYLIVNINGMNVEVTAIDENDNIVDNFNFSKTTSTALVPAWATTTICENDAPIALNNLLHPNATPNGTWTGTGVSNNTFDPTALSGNVTLTYTLGTAPCKKDSTQNIFVNPTPDASWANSTVLCDSDPAINLNALITTGQTNGIWTGTGVTGNNFDPLGLSGNIAITYTVTSAAGCTNTLTQNIVVETTPNVTWTAPSSVLCDTDPALNLTTLLDANADNTGTWTGSGVVGSSFNPNGLNGNIALTYSVNGANCSNTLTQNIVVTNCAIVAKIKILLEGSYDSGTGLMATNLRSSGTLPTTQPFNSSPWQYAGTEAVSGLADIPSNISDWVLVELRDANNYNTMVAQRAAFLRNDGLIVDIDGMTNGLIFPSLLTGDDYYVVVRTRNHLATMSAAAVALPNTTMYDFSTAMNQAFGANQMTTLGAGIFGQYAGDFDNNGIVNVADFNIYDDELSNTGTYSAADANMDNTVSIGDFNSYRPNASVIGVGVIRYQELNQTIACLLLRQVFFQKNK